MINTHSKGDPMNDQTHQDNLFRRLTGPLIVLTREIADQGWVPATSGNFSVRYDDQHAIITVKGRDKGKLTEEALMLIDFDGNPIDSDEEPSTETLLHTMLYKHSAEIGCVLHTFSTAQTVASKLFADQGSMSFGGYEVLKAFRGNHSKELAIDLPVINNHEDLGMIHDHVAEALAKQPHLFGYLVEGRGLYVWGKDIKDARRHLQAFEHLIACELMLQTLN